MQNESKEIEREKIEESDHKITNVRDFMNMMLLDISETEFRKINNVIIVLLGSVSPSLPLILLFRMDLVNSINIVLLLTIIILVNLTITIIISAFNSVSIRSELDFKRSNILKIKIKLDINDEKGKIKRNKKLKNKLTKTVNKYRNLKKDEGYNETFMQIIILNIIIGFFIIAAKVINYIEIIEHINFKEVLVLSIFLYLCISLNFIFYNILELLNKLRIKRLMNIRDKIYSKNKYEQISMFDYKDIEL